MGDDELSLHAESLIRMSGRSDVGFLDPLLATGWLQTGTPDKVQTWMAQHPGVTTIVSVVCSDGHWIPVIWSDGMTEVHVSIWGSKITQWIFSTLFTGSSARHGESRGSQLLARAVCLPKPTVGVLLWLSLPITS